MAMGSDSETRVEEFRAAGRTLFSLGLVRGTEGNLSEFDGNRLIITRTGSSLASLSAEDLVSGGIDDVLARTASSDLEVHRAAYRAGGPGAIAHAHPAGTVPEGGGEPGRHGVYEHGRTLGDAVDAIVRASRVPR